MDEQGTQCGCKGARYCHQCLDSPRVRSLRDAPNIKLDCALSQLKLWDVPGASTGCFHVWCSECRLAHERHFPADVDLEHIEALSREKCRVGVNDIHLDGLRLILDFVTESEEAALVESIDSRPWAPSQSGRRKQDYGPKVNFKKQKLKLDIFEGVPHYAPMLLSRMEHSGITDYVPVEMCNLEYCKSKASAIEPHIDDTWVWGERLISVNLLSGAVIVFVSVSTDQCVFVHMPRRSLLMISGPCRYEWRHAVTSFHMDQSRRIALTMREAASRFKPGGQLYESGGGRQLLEKGSTVLGAGHGIFCVGDDLMDRDLPPLG